MPIRLCAFALTGRLSPSRFSLAGGRDRGAKPPEGDTSVGRVTGGSFADLSEGKERGRVLCPRPEGAGKSGGGS